MNEITITLPDGSQRKVPSGTTPLEIARSLGRRLAEDAVAARVNGDLYDLTRPLRSDARLEILTSRNAEALEIYRHSVAHLMAAAVQELYPETKLGIGPATEAGFFYDFQREEKFTPADLEKIEAKMWELQKKDLPYVRRLTPKAEGLPRPARAVHLAHQGFQASFGCRRLLEGRRAQPADAAHPRHGFLHEEGPGSLPETVGRGAQARPSQARPGARSVQHSTAGRSGPDLFPSQGRHRAHHHGELDAGAVHQARLLAGLHAPHRAGGPVEDLRSL